jgi:ribosomal protein S18 acetylase RimI-like enzyme
MRRMQIRPLEPKEVAAVDSALPLSRLDAQSGGYLVAWDGDRPVGHAHLDGAEVGDVWVLPDRRGRGIATALMTAAEEVARTAGAEELELVARVDDDRVMRLYERLGFRRAGRPYRMVAELVIRGAPLSVDEVLVRMRKPLAPGG